MRRGFFDNLEAATTCGDPSPRRLTRRGSQGKGKYEPNPARTPAGSKGLQECGRMLGPWDRQSRPQAERQWHTIRPEEYPHRFVPWIGARDERQHG